ncbi:MAG: hypothetical protein ABII82_16460, partial [Verrucomicrobiota bacterium]
SAQRAFDPSIFNELLDPHKDLPLTQQSIQAAVTKMLHASRDTAIKQCKKSDNCCKEVIISLACSQVKQLITGPIGQGAINSSIADMDPNRCGKFWKYNCKTGQVSGPYRN